MNEFMANNKAYFIAILLPVVFFIGSTVYISGFDVPLLSQMKISESKVQEEGVEPAPRPNVWTKVKDKENPDTKELVLALTELQKEADILGDAEKVYTLQEIELMNVKMGEKIGQFSKLEKYFYFPPSTAPQEVVTLDDVEVLGIFYGRANIKVTEDEKEKEILVREGQTIKKGKVKIEKISSNVVIFSVEGKKVEKAIKK